MSLPTETPFDALISVNIGDLIDVVRPIVEAGLVPFLWGPPGIGKTDKVAQMVDEMGGFHFVDYRASEREPTDLTGFPVPDTASGTMKFLPPAELRSPDGKPIALSIDEYNQAGPEMQRASLRLLLSPETYLPKDSIVLAAGNRQKDRAGVQALLSPVASRFLHLEVQPVLEDWIKWALAAGISSKAIAYAKFQPDVITGVASMTLAPGERAFASPRSFAQVARVFEAVPPKHRLAVICGKLGAVHGPMFAAFLDHLASLPPIDLIIAKPKAAPLPDASDLGQCWALTGALVDHLRQRAKRNGDVSQTTSLEDMFGAILDYAERLPGEFTARVAFGAIEAHAGLSATKAWLDFANRRSDITG